MPSLLELIADYGDAWNRQDLDAICALHADAMVFENHNAGERAEGDSGSRPHRNDLRELARPPLRGAIDVRRRRLRRAGVDGVRDPCERRSADLGRRRHLPVRRREDPAQGRLLERLATRPAAARGGAPRRPEQPLEKGDVDRVDELVGGSKTVVGQRAADGDAPEAGGLRRGDARLRVLERNRVGRIEARPIRAPGGTPRDGACRARRRLRRRSP